MPRPRPRAAIRCSGPHRAGPRAGLGAVVALLVVVVAAVTGAVLPAAAHSDDGEMTVTRSEVVDATTVALEVGLLYADDDDLATEATVTATATSPSGGAAAGPVALPNVGGARYGATFVVPEPGVWAITITATDPAAEATVEVDTSAAVAAPASSTTAPQEEVVGSTTTAGDEPAAVATEATSASDEADSSAIPPVLIGIIALVVVLGGGAALAALQRREHADG